jgi:hypothetical protein
MCSSREFAAPPPPSRQVSPPWRHMQDLQSTRLPPWQSFGDVRPLGFYGQETASLSCRRVGSLFFSTSTFSVKRANEGDDVGAVFFVPHLNRFSYAGLHPLKQSFSSRFCLQFLIRRLKTPHCEHTVDPVLLRSVAFKCSHRAPAHTSLSFHSG